MKAISTQRIPLVFSLVLILPLAFMEVVNRQRYGGDFPWMLFAVLWLLAATFSLLSYSLWQNSRLNGATIVKSTFLLAALVAWFLLVKDQMPCFLGVYNCD